MSLAFQALLCPLDFSSGSREALRYAARLAQIVGGRLTALHVIEPLPYPVEYGLAPTAALDLEPKLAEGAREHLARVIEADVPKALPTESRVELGSPETTICEVAERDRFDLIVLATHGRKGLAHLFLGSVAERVVRLAPCPVLTLKPRGAESHGT